MRYEFIKAQEGEYPIAGMCQLLEVSPSGYYAWRGRRESRRRRDEKQLVVAIRAFHKASRGTYGSPRIHKDLEAGGMRCGENRVARLMRKHGVRAKQARKFKATTDSRHDQPVAENLLGQDFEVNKPDTRWVADITYIATRAGWLYLAVILDLYSRRVVGWSTSDRIDRELVIQALKAALWQRQPGPGLMHHSDRGSQYASSDFRQILRSRGIECSMSRKGNCYDNAVAESFFHTLKVECVNDENYRTRGQARTSLFDYIEGFYNTRRRHSTLGYISPVDYEKLSLAA